MRINQEYQGVASNSGASNFRAIVSTEHNEKGSASCAQSNSTEALLTDEIGPKLVDPAPLNDVTTCRRVPPEEEELKMCERCTVFSIESDLKCCEGCGTFGHTDCLDGQILGDQLVCFLCRESKNTALHGGDDVVDLENGQSIPRFEQRMCQRRKESSITKEMETCKGCGTFWNMLWSETFGQDSFFCPTCVNKEMQIGGPSQIIDLEQDGGPTGTTEQFDELREQEKNIERVMLEAGIEGGVKDRDTEPGHVDEGNTHELLDKHAFGGGDQKLPEGDIEISGKKIVVPHNSFKGWREVGGVQDLDDGKRMEGSSREFEAVETRNDLFIPLEPNTSDDSETEDPAWAVELQEFFASRGCTASGYEEEPVSRKASRDEDASSEITDVKQKSLKDIILRKWCAKRIPGGGERNPKSSGTLKVITKKTRSLNRSRIPGVEDDPRQASSAHRDHNVNMGDIEEPPLPLRTQSGPPAVDLDAESLMPCVSLAHPTSSSDPSDPEILWSSYRSSDGKYWISLS